MRVALSILLSAQAALGAGIPMMKRQVAQPDRLFIGTPGAILVTEFDGANFSLVANISQEGANPSWMAFRQPNLLYAVDEFSDNTNLFLFDPNTNFLSRQQSAVGSSGVVHLEFNRDQTRMVGSSFVQGMIDIWDIADGNLNLLKQIASTDPLGPNAARQDAPHPHQAVLDPSSRFFVVNDLGTDTLLVLDSENDEFEVVNRVRVTPDGCGPRHGAFFPRGADAATHYILLCELLNLVEVFQVTYTDNNIQFFPVQVLSSFGQDFPPVDFAVATAGEIAISSDNQDVYVSNRNTGLDTDSISHFRIVPASPGGPISLEFSESTPSGGLIPRMFSLSLDESLLFSTNQNTGNGLVVLARNQNGQTVSLQDLDAQVESAGTLIDNPLAAVPNNIFGGENAGPQFIMQVAFA